VAREIWRGATFLSHGDVIVGVRSYCRGAKLLSGCEVIVRVRSYCRMARLSHNKDDTAPLMIFRTHQGLLLLERSLLPTQHYSPAFRTVTELDLGRQFQLSSFASPSASAPSASDLYVYRWCLRNVIACSLNFYALCLQRTLILRGHRTL
jgi:hypothetical protein